MTLTIEMPADEHWIHSPAALSPWNQSRGKRLFDLIVAFIVLTLSSPLLLVVALAVRVSTKGPVIYSQWRMGKDGKQFRLLKFRTMVDEQQRSGPRITRAGDPRITKLGFLLRKWKLDELPQLFNVIRGHMSLVGPRPDLPEYSVCLNTAQNQILSLYPGLTSLATLRFRNEEQLLAEVPNEQLEKFYCNELLPEKVRIDLEYAQTAGLLTDITILFLTARAILTRR